MTTLATDTFTRANTTGLGANWTQDEGSGSITFNVSTNAATNSNDNADGTYFNNTATWPNDQYSQANVTLNATISGQDGPGVAVRLAAGAVTYYRCVWSLGAGVFITKKVAGAYTLLSSPAATTTNGDLFRIEAQGTTIRVVLNGVTKGTSTDSSIASGNAGLSYSADGSAKVATWDNWEGGDFSAGGAAVEIDHLLLIGCT